MATTLQLPDDMTMAALLQLAEATGKRLRSIPIPPKPKDLPDGYDRRVTHLRPGRRVAGQQRQPGKDATR